MKNDLIKIGMIFHFTLGDDTIVYKMLREFHNTEDMFDYVEVYAQNFVKKFGEKYGRCIFCDVVYNAVPIITYYFNRNGVIKDERNW